MGSDVAVGIAIDTTGWVMLFRDGDGDGDGDGYAFLGTTLLNIR